MSNSIKYRPYSHFCSGSNAQWKRLVNREFRRVNKVRVQLQKEPVVFDEVANLWASPLDGSAHHVNGVKFEKGKRMKGKWIKTVKTPEYYEKAFRK